jgi:GGDEF domain-containing protein
MQTSEISKRDPRRLRALMDRAFFLMSDHQVGSAFIGVAGPEGDLLVPEFISYLESALRVEDGVFVLTRERAVLLLTDVTVENAERVVERLREDFSNRFPSAHDLEVSIRYVEIGPGSDRPTAKAILPELFTG